MLKGLDPLIGRLDGVAAPEALRAILTTIPLDQSVEAPVTVMPVVDDPTATPEIFPQFQEIVDAAEARAVTMKRVDRFAFYDLARQAFGVVVTSETRLYGNIIVSKSVIAPAVAP